MFLLISASDLIVLFIFPTVDLLSALLISPPICWWFCRVDWTLVCHLVEFVKGEKLKTVRNPLYQFDWETVMSFNSLCNYRGILLSITAVVFKWFLHNGDQLVVWSMDEMCLKLFRGCFRGFTGSDTEIPREVSGLYAEGGRGRWANENIFRLRDE